MLSSFITPWLADHGEICLAAPPGHGAVTVVTPDLCVASTERPRVLVVEPDPAMRKMLLALLSADYEVESVPDEAAAQASVQRGLVTLILIDLQAANAGTLGLIRALHADARTGRIPVVVLTASQDRPLLLRCLAAGASNFLLKPFGRRELLDCVRQEMESPHAAAPCARLPI